MKKADFIDSLPPFTKAYITCALWSSTDDNSTPLDDNYSVQDITFPSLKLIAFECNRFYEDYYHYFKNDWDDEQAGHDFWLTRNGHGTGFWDRGKEDFIQKQLTVFSHQAGECSLYTYRKKLYYFQG